MKSLYLVLFSLSFYALSFSQDLSLKIDNKAYSVLKVNGNQILKNISLSDINNSYLFSYILKNKFNSNLGVDLIEDFGVDFNQNFYMVEESHDDYFLTYYLYALKDVKQFESLISNDAELIEQKDGIKYAKYGSNMRLIWNNGLVLFIHVKSYKYFNEYEYGFYDEFYYQDSISFPEDYNIKPKKYTYKYDLNDEEIEAIPPPPTISSGNKNETDSIEYVKYLIEQDKLKQRSEAKTKRKENYRKEKKKIFINNKNKEIDELMWFKTNQVYKNEHLNSINTAQLNFNDKAVASLFISTASTNNPFYFLRYPYHYGVVQMSMYYTLTQSLMFSESFNLNLFFNDNDIVVKSDLKISEKLKNSLKNISKTKINNKFLKYIPNHALAYASFAINTEAYVDEYPNFIEYLINDIDSSYSEEASVIAELFNVFFDSKEINELFTGDAVLIWNKLNYKKVDHITYEYDNETFEYTQKVELKDELLPEFTFMFGSKKEDIIQKIFKVLVKHNLMRPYNNYYYFSHEDIDDLPFNIYIAFQDNIVFITSDDQQINDINNKKVSDRLNKSNIKMIKKNNFSFYINLEQIFNSIPLKDLDDKERDYVMFGRSNLKNISSFNYYKDGAYKATTTMSIPSSEKNVTKYVLKLASEFLLIDKK